VSVLDTIGSKSRKASVGRGDPALTQPNFSKGLLPTPKYDLQSHFSDDSLPSQSSAGAMQNQ